MQKILCINNLAITLKPCREKATLKIKIFYYQSKTSKFQRILTLVFPQKG